MSSPVEEHARTFAELHTRLAGVRAESDGTIFAEPSGGHFVTVTKEASNVLLWLMDQNADGSGVVQSELDVENPLALVDPYTQAATLALLWAPTPARIYTTGLGGGCLPTVLHHYFPMTHIQCVEIDACVVKAAQRCFGFQPDHYLRVAVDDGRRWLEANPAAGNYDIMLFDAFLDNGYSPYKMATREFAELCSQRLAPGGVVVLNLLYLGTHYTERVKTMAAVFPHLYLLRMGEENDLLFASQTPLPAAADLRDLAMSIRRRHPFQFLFVRRAVKLIPLEQADLPAWEATPVLTDDAPPADYFATMPSMAGPLSAPDPTAPCFCGSGLDYDHCHGCSPARA